MTRRTVGRGANILDAAAIMALEEDMEHNYIESLQIIVTIELRALGLTDKEIEIAAEFGIYPQDSRIEKLIKDFDADKSNWAKIRPLTFDAYTRRLYILESMEACTTTIESETDGGLTPEEWLNRGAILAYYAYRADSDYIDILNKAEFGAIGGKGRAGKIFSPAKIAISHALSVGCKSAKEVQSYFEAEPVIDEHNIEVYCERDESGEPESFSFMNLSNGVMSRPMKSTTLPSAVSQTKTHLKNK